MMTCEQITRAAGEFLERRLRFRERLQFLMHVAMCKGCRNYVDQFRITLMALRAVPRTTVAEVSPELLEHFRKERGPGR